MAPRAELAAGCAERVADAPRDVPRPRRDLECGICLEESEARVSLCGRAACAARFCVPCVAQYVTQRVRDAPLCVSRPVQCAACQAHVPLARWRAFVPDGVVQRHATGARNALSIQCASCHSRATLLPEPVAPRRAAAAAAVPAAVRDAVRRLDAGLATPAEVVRVMDTFRTGTNETVEQFQERLAALERQYDEYCRVTLVQVLCSTQEGKLWHRRKLDPRGKLTPERREARLARKAVRENQAMANCKRCELGLDKARVQAKRVLAASPDTMAMRVATLVQDPERRAALLLAALRARPTVKTHCCGKHHCFSCKTVSWHAPDDCRRRREVEAERAAAVVVRRCPSCSVPFVRAGGCNTITCICGERFNEALAPVVAL